MNELIKSLEQEQLKNEVPNFGPGDTVRVHVKIVEVVLNYEKITLVVVAYRFNIEGLLQLNAEAPIFVQVRPVAQTSVVVAPVALPRETFVVRV